MILLFPYKKSLGKTKTIGNCNGKNIIAQRRAYRLAIKKGEDTLTNQIWLHLHAPKQIIYVAKLKVDNLLCVRKKDGDYFYNKKLWQQS